MRFAAIVVTLCASVLAGAAEQQPAKPAPPSVPNNSAWYEPAEPLKIVGPIHYVGTQDLAVYLITTPAGHILIDGAMPPSASLVEASIRKLGFKPEDIRILLTTQGHADHVGTLAHFKKISGGRVEVMTGDAELVKSGGKADYLFASAPQLHFDPVTADRVLKDGDTISLGGITLTARHTPGHTPGCSTYLTSVTDGGRTYRVMFAGSTSVNPGTRFVKDPSYPNILEDYRKTFRLLETMQFDIFLGAHASFFDLEGKRARMKERGVEAFVDREGYFKQLASSKAAFEALVVKEQ